MGEKTKDLIKGLVVAIFVVLAFNSLMFVSVALKAWGEMPEELVGRYMIFYDPMLTLGVKTGEHTEDMYDENMFIEEYENSDDFILIYAMLASEEIGYDKWDIYRENDLCKVRNGFTPAFYIVDVKKDAVHGPLGMAEYVKLREELGVPEDLSLKVRMNL